MSAPMIVGFAPAKVGHRQTPFTKPPPVRGFCYCNGTSTQPVCKLSKPIWLTTGLPHHALSRRGFHPLPPPGEGPGMRACAGSLMKASYATLLNTKFCNFSIRHGNPIDQVTRPIATSPVANALSRSTLQPVASKRNHRGSAGFRPAVFKDAGKDACATGTRQSFFNLPGLGYITTPRKRALTALCPDLLRSYRVFT